MQTTAWREHTPIDLPDDITIPMGMCLTCGLVIPRAAIAEGKAYQNGGIWSANPKGNALPCRMEK